MRPATVPAFVLFGLVSLSGNAYAEDPCCTVVSVRPDPVEPSNGIVTARDTKTGRTFSFKADGLDSKGLKVGDKLDADLASGRLTSLKGVSRAYAVFEPDAAAPCCDIVSIQPDPFEPGNGIVTARDAKTGRTFQFSATAAIRNELKVGQAVGLNQANTMAHVQSGATGARGKPAAYSYSVKGSAGCPESLTAQREQVAGAPRPGQTGRLLVALPDSAHYIVNIFRGDVKLKQLMRLKLFDLIPGEYEVKISNAGVFDVPITRGCDTRVRAGVLNVTLAAGQAWHVYDEAAKVRVESGRGPEQIGLLVGKYQMMVGKDFTPVEIQDKKTATF